MLGWVTGIIAFILRGLGIGHKSAAVTPETAEIEKLASSNATAQTQLGQEKTNDASIVEQKAAVASADRGVAADIAAAGVPVDPEAPGSAAVLTDDGGRRD